MRRPAALVLGTILGSALLAGARLFAHPTGSETVFTGPADGGVPIDGGAGPGVPAPTGAPKVDPTGTPGTGATPRAGSTPVAGATTAGVTKPPTAPADSGGSALGSGTFTGAAITHKYGTLQVTITVSGGRITTIVETYKTSLRTSAKINSEAIPKLRQAALVAQSATIDTVSGATYTSDAYRASLTSALDKSKS